MVIFHLFITSTFPLAVPLEWNVFFGYIVHRAVGRLRRRIRRVVYNIWNFSEPLLLIPIFALLLFFPIWGNLRPDLVSFLPSMRQYAGNWASAMWAMQPGIEERLNELPLVENQVDQLQRMKPTPYEKDDAEMTMQKAARVALAAQPGPWPVLGAVSTSTTSSRGPSVTASSSATRSSAGTSATATCTTSG